MPSILCAAQEPQKIVERGVGKEPWTRLFATQESVVHTVRILRSNKILKGCANQALAECNSVGKHRARYGFFPHLEYDCQFSAHCSNSEVSVRLKAERIDEAKKRLSKRDYRKGVIRFKWQSECEGVSSLSFKSNAVTLSRTCAKATCNVSAEHSEKRLRLFRHDIALDFYCMFSGYTPWSNECDSVEGSIAQLARLDAWISTVMTYLTERES